MKITRSYFYLCMILLMALAACAPASAVTPTPVIIVVTATEEAPATPPVTEAPPETSASPTAVNLAGPPMQVGSTYLYFDGTTLVAVPGGPFMMGHGGSDSPEHEVTLSDFWIYSTKVTNQQYAQCVKQGICTAPDLNDNRVYSNPLEANDPVVGVNWSQAQAYCGFAHGFLPTEAQWEKTARGPKEVANLYPWGNNTPSCDLLNYKGCIGETTHVTRYPQGQSYYKALELEGNVYEWVSDWYDAYYYRNGPLTDPLGPEIGNTRSVRSASFHSNDDQAPSFKRFFKNPTEHARDLGFRCVVLDPTFFAPLCQLSSYLGPNIGGNTPSLGFKLQCPEVSATAGQLNCGSNTTIITFTDSDPDDPNVNFSAPGCTQISSDTSGGQLVVKFQCIGQTGTASISSKCMYAGGVTSSCPAHYNLDTTTKSCNWDGSGTAGTECPSGYEYDPVLKCCASQAGLGKDFPACPTGSSLADTGTGEYVCFDQGLYDAVTPASADEAPPGACPPPPGSDGGSCVSPNSCVYPKMYDGRCHCVCMPGYQC